MRAGGAGVSGLCTGQVGTGHGVGCTGETGSRQGLDRGQRGQCRLVRGGSGRISGQCQLDPIEPGAKHWAGFAHSGHSFGPSGFALAVAARFLWPCGSAQPGCAAQHGHLSAQPPSSLALVPHFLARQPNLVARSAGWLVLGGHGISLGAISVKGKRCQVCGVEEVQVGPG